MILQENKETWMINFVAKSVFGLKKKYPIGKNCKETLTKIALYSGPILSIKILLVADCLYGILLNLCTSYLRKIKEFFGKDCAKIRFWLKKKLGFGENCKETLLSIKVLYKHYILFFLLYSDRKWKILINDWCRTLSGHFFAICMSIFNKTEVQTVILRCWTGLYLDSFTSYGLRCNLRLSASSANSRKIATDRWPCNEHTWPFFANCTFIFHKTEIQTIILGC